MFNVTQMAPSSSASASTYRATHNPAVINHHLESNQANNLGYGVGRWLGMAIDKIGNTWGNWWNRPSAEQLSNQRRITIIRHQIRELIPELTSALNKIPKNSKDPRALNWALKRIQTIASDKMSLLVPNEDEDLRDYQTKQFKPLEDRISKLPTFVKDKLRPLIPILFQNMKSAEKGMDGQEKKNGSNPQRISEFNHERASYRDDGSSLHQYHSGRSFLAAFNLASLNGANGFILNGININDQSGTSVASAGDVNGDGIDDLIIGAPGNNPNNAGQSYVVFGSKSSWSSRISLSSLNGNNGFILNGINSGDGSGSSVASAGDVNGDGIDDLIVGAPIAFSQAVQSYVIFGSKASWSSPFNLTNLNGNNGFILNGGINSFRTKGISVASAGDVNGDGIDDLIVGAPGVPNNAGQSYVVFGSKARWSSPFSLTSLNGTNGFILNGITSGDESGHSVANAGDVNGDGIGDLILGAPFASANTGQSYVVFGSKASWSSPISPSSLNGNNGFIINGNGGNNQNGASVASGGDVNGDGIGDLIVGDPEAFFNVGQSYVVFGSKASWSSPFSFTSLDGANGFALNGINELDISGYSVASAGDVNGDGIGDLIVGAPQDANGGAGQSYVVFGSKSSWSTPISLSSLDGTNGFTLNGINSGDLSGTSVASAGDVNGDGIGDLIVGAPGASSGAGQSYVFFGQKIPVPTSTSTTTTSTTTTTTSTPPGSSINIGAIVGGVIGGTLLVAAAATVVALKVLKKGCFSEKPIEAPNRMNNQAIFNDDKL